MHLRPTVVRLVVSRADPRFASAVIELRDARDRRRGSAAVLVFERVHGAAVLAGPAIARPISVGPTGAR